MDSIDVRDLPEKVAKALAETVSNLKAQLGKDARDASTTEPLRWPLGAKGQLRREEIYDHLD